MKSSIEGCARFCDGCPNKPAEPSFLLDEAAINQLHSNSFEPLVADVDPADVNTIVNNRVMSLADCNKPDAPSASYATFRRSGTLNAGVHVFPVTTTLDMIKKCNGPTKIKRSLFRSSMVCGAYQAGLDALPDDEAARTAYIAFIEDEERTRESRRR